MQTCLDVIREEMQEFQYKNNNSNNSLFPSYTHIRKPAKPTPILRFLGSAHLNSQPQQRKYKSKISHESLYNDSKFSGFGPLAVPENIYPKNTNSSTPHSNEYTRTSRDAKQSRFQNQITHRSQKIDT